MSIYAVWPYFLSMAILLALASTRLFAAADTPPSPKPQRVVTLDGLRGFLALGVFFQHAVIYYKFLKDGVWDFPPEPFYITLAESSVALFFMITGYLFWSLLLRKHGNPGWASLYIQRFFRIAPLYFCAIMFVFIYVFYVAQWHLLVSWFSLFKQITKVMMLGLIPLGDTNNYPQTYLILAGVLWTLQYEWAFYLSLPFITLLACYPKAHLPLIVGSVLVVLAYVVLHPVISNRANAVLGVLLFLCGMISASLQDRGYRITLRTPVASLLTIGILIVTFLFFPEPDNAGFQAFAFVLLAIVFYLIVNGCTVFGLLTSRPACRLGNISYGMYLLQGAVLRLVLSHPAINAYALSSPLHYWIIILANAVLLMAVATAAHVYIERPCIDVGKRLSAGIGKTKSPA